MWGSARCQRLHCSSRHVEDGPRRHELAAAAREVPAAAAYRVAVHVLRPVHETAVAPAAHGNVVDRTHTAGCRTAPAIQGAGRKERVGEEGNIRTAKK